MFWILFALSYLATAALVAAALHIAGAEDDAAGAMGLLWPGSVPLIALFALSVLLGHIGSKISGLLMRWVKQ